MSDIKVAETITDTITGKSTATTITIGSTPVVSSSANSMTIRGEGTAQTSIQQGLAKCWCNLEGDGTIAISDSFNVSGITDRGTGLYTITINNDMANALYSITASGTHDAGSYVQSSVVSHDDAPTTGSYGIDTLNYNSGGQPTDTEMVSSTIHGDLA